MEVSTVAVALAEGVLQLLSDEGSPMPAELEGELRDLATDAATFAVLQLSGEDANHAFAGIKARALNLKSAGHSVAAARVLAAVHQLATGRIDAALRRVLVLPL